MRTTQQTHVIPTRIVSFAAGIMVTLLCAVTANDAFAGKIYRCVDEQTKKVTVSDSPCAYATAEKGKTADADKKGADKKDAAADAKAAQKKDSAPDTKGAQKKDPKG